MPDTAAPSAPAAPAPAATPSAPAPAPTPAPAVPASPSPAPTVENSSSIAEAWQRAQAEVPVGVEDAELEAPAPEAAAPQAQDDDQPDAAPAPADEVEVQAGDQPEVQLDPDLALPEIALEDGDFGPKELGDFLKKDAAVDKFFNDHPEVKNRIFGMARRDSETRAIREIAPTVEIAQEMQRGHKLFHDIDNRFLTATTPEGFKSFMDMWVEQALITDDKGQPSEARTENTKSIPRSPASSRTFTPTATPIFSERWRKTARFPRPSPTPP